MTKQAIQDIALGATIALLMLFLSSDLLADVQPPDEDTLVLVTECETTVVYVDRPVYLDNGSRSVYDAHTQTLYLYDTEVWEGPKRTLMGISYAVLEYAENGMFELTELEP